MCSGVMVMIRTITTWTVTRATMATGTLGRRMTLRNEAAVVRSAPDGVAEWSASRYGSGRRAARVRTMATPTNRIGTRYGPVSGGRPIDSAKAVAGATRFGPMTA